MTRLSALVLVCALAACTGDVSARAPQGTGKPTGSAEIAIAKPPRVQMQVGTSFINGRLVRVCTKAGCSDGDGSDRIATLTDERLIMFTVARKPKAASVRIERGSKVVGKAALPPAYTMAHAVNLREGRYRVILDAEWKGIRARWSFGLRVSGV